MCNRTIVNVVCDNPTSDFITSRMYKAEENGTYEMEIGKNCKVLLLKQHIKYCYVNNTYYFQKQNNN